jgi:subtilisin family serine protease
MSIRFVRGRFHAGLAGVLLLPFPAGADSLGPFVQGEVVARLQPATEAAVFAAGYGSGVLASIPSRNFHRLSIPVGLTESEFADLIDDDPRVVRVELNFIGEDVDPDGTTQSIFVQETSEAFSEQPAMDLIGADAAQTYTTGGGVLVAVIDSGIDLQHPLFAGRLPMGGIDLVDGDATPQDLGDGLDNNADGRIDEMVGHGTLVAGLVLRVAPQADLLPIRVLDSDGGTTTFRMIDGLYAAIDRGARIVNISMGTIAESPALAEAVQESVSAGALIIAAAGNDATDQVRRFPAGFASQGLISVASVNNLDIVSPFSNFGESISIAAPGDPVVGPAPSGGFGSARGTSFAAPVVAGVAALVLSADPALELGTLRDRLLATSRPIDDTNPDYAGSIGAGRVDALAAVLATTPGCNPADLAHPYGLLDLADITAYINLFTTQDPAADLDRNDLFDLDDLLLFIDAFAVGCP